MVFAANGWKISVFTVCHYCYCLIKSYWQNNKIRLHIYFLIKHIIYSCREFYMFRKLNITLLFIICAISGYSFSIKESISFRPEISASYFGADGSVKNFTKTDTYKSGSAVLNMPVYISILNNIYADINYFIRADYNKNIDEDTLYHYNFSKANLNYKTEDLSLKLGRQAYFSSGKDFVIYYGDYSDKDNILPSALDGLTHSYKWKALSYEVLFAREVRKLSPNNENSLIYGGVLGLDPFNFINFEGFYYKRATSLDAVETDLYVYGGGLNLSINESFEASFYAAFNGGTEEKIVRRRVINTDYKGYALSGSLKLKSDNDYAKTSYTLKAYYGSPKELDSKAYTPISQNLDTGFVFGGINILRNNTFSGLPQNNSELPAFMMYGFKVELVPHFLNNTYAGLGLYNFMTSDKELPYRDIGSEFDIELGYRNSSFSVTAIYGILFSGNGLGPVTQSEVPSGKNIQKFGFYTSFGFDVL